VTPIKSAVVGSLRLPHPQMVACWPAITCCPGMTFGAF